MDDQPNKPLSFTERMKLKAMQQEKYGGVMMEKTPEMAAADCPNCGAGRAKHEGVTHCAYCGFQFLGQKITDGIHLSAEDNSKPFK